MLYCIMHEDTLARISLAFSYFSQYFFRFLKCDVNTPNLINNNKPVVVSFFNTIKQYLTQILKHIFISIDLSRYSHSK